jgi:mannose-6-phosphate isomerase-like protein (cupin superfamily)
MQAAQSKAETLWFVSSRVQILVAESTYSLVEEQAQHANMPPLHVHHDHDEVFYLLGGKVSIHLPGSRIDLAAGQATFAPRGVPHTYRVESADGAHWLVSTNSGGFAAFVDVVSVPAEGDGYAPPEALPAPADLAAAAARFGIEVLGPPGALPN